MHFDCTFECEIYSFLCHNVMVWYPAILLFERLMDYINMVPSSIILFKSIKIMSHTVVYTINSYQTISVSHNEYYWDNIFDHDIVRHASDRTLGIAFYGFLRYQSVQFKTKFSQNWNKMKTLFVSSIIQFSYRYAQHVTSSLDVRDAKVN